jgi:hypothetical protein
MRASFRDRLERAFVCVNANEVRHGEPDKRLSPVLVVVRTYYDRVLSQSLPIGQKVEREPDSSELRNIPRCADITVIAEDAPHRGHSDLVLEQHENFRRPPVVVPVRMCA